MKRVKLLLRLNENTKKLNANHEYNEKTKELYSEISLVRREYEKKIKNPELEIKDRNNFVNFSTFYTIRSNFSFVESFVFSTNSLVDSYVFQRDVQERSFAVLVL